MRKSGSEVVGELFVGMFMVAVLGVLFYFTVIISGKDLLSGKRSVPVEVTFADVGGLKVRDSVVMRGMVVGSVSEMRIERDHVRVRLSLNPDVTFREGYQIDVRATSLLGGNNLVIEEGGGAALPQDAALVGHPPSNWMRDLGEVVSNLREATSGEHLKNTVANLEEASESLKHLIARVDSGKGTLGKLFSDDETLYDDLSASVANIKAITEKLNGGEGSIARLLNDDGGVYDDLRGTVANVKSISDRLEKGEGTIGRLLSSDDSLYNDLQETMANLKGFTARLEQGEGSLGMLLKDDNKIYNDIEATVANLKTVSERLANGEGTLGKLSADDQLYNDVHGLIKDVRQTVDNFRDTMPITAFTSLLTGAL
ncbi:MAG: MlaD family protein [Kiritimatiellaeota bacterium]|nr:MlaD family protein [Kiritimatiellota bacterium]